MSEPAAIKYRGFLSYSHADTRWAKRLHGRLEGFPIDGDLVGRETSVGPVPRALRPIFRDRDEFTAGHTLTDQTITALDQSAALIVLATPSSAKSFYVNEEIRLFKSRHPDRPVIPVIADGQPGHAERECFPPAVRFEVGTDGTVTDRPTALLAADLREEGDGEDLALSKVVATLIGLGTDDVFRRAQREHRRRQRRWIAGLSVVALLLAGLAGWAEINRREAVAQREAAERNFAVAKQGADALIFDIAQSLRNQEGMRAETVGRILGSAEQVIDKLAASAGGNPELMRSQAAMLVEFADTYAAQGDTARRVEATTKSLAIVTELARSDPGNRGWQHDLSVAYAKAGDAVGAKGDVAGALKLYEEAVAVAERLAAADPSNVPWQHNLAGSRDRAGNALLSLGRRAEALEGYEASRGILQRLTAADPSNVILQRDLGVAYNKIGDVLAAEGKHQEAATSYRDSLAIMEGLAKGDAGNVLWQRDMAVSHAKIGDVLLAEGQRGGSLKSYEASVAILERLINTDPSNASWQYDLGRAYAKAGQVLDADGKHAEALPRRRQALVIAQRFAADAANVDRQRELSAAHAAVGETLAALERDAEALESYKQGLAVAERVAAANPANNDAQADLASSYGRVGIALVQLDRKDEAREAFGKARAVLVPLVARTDLAVLKTYLKQIEDVLLQLDK